MSRYKKIKLLTFISLCALLSIKAQKIAFYQNGTLNVHGTTSKVQESSIYDMDSYVYETDKKVFQVDEMPGILKLPEDHLFYVGMQSPYQQEVWLYVEKEITETEYTLWHYNSITGEQKVIMTNETGPDPSLQYMPIAWSSDPEVIYLEGAKDFESEQTHEGIYTYNFKTLQSKKLKISNTYTSTPQISPDRESFVYTASELSGDLRNFAHGVSDKIVEFNIASEKAQSIENAFGSEYSVKGWFQKSAKQTNIKRASKQLAKASVTYKMPWPAGVSYCVSRAGIPAPTGPVGSSVSCFNKAGQHDYVALDFADSSGHVMLAVASGRVLHAGFDVSLSVGLGNYVTVLHDNGIRSVYGHLSRVDVKVGDVVCQGFPLGFEGNTGASFGRHLHFELRTQARRSPGNRYPVFSDCNGCSPRANRLYVSKNSINKSCTPISTCKSSLNLTNVIKSDTYKSSNTITASGTIADTRTVVFNAKGAITLKPGFVAKEGATFTAKIGRGCSAKSNKNDSELYASLDESNEKEALKQSLKIFPNPVNTVLNIQIPIVNNQTPTAYQVNDIQGRKILEKTLQGGTAKGDVLSYQLATESLPNGLYFYTLIIGGKKITKEFMVAR